jgi:hypothetical protein
VIKSDGNEISRKEMAMKRFFLIIKGLAVIISNTNTGRNIT